MKTITRIFAMLAVISAAIFMDACKGEKGDVGPAGTTGAVGAVGATGAIGPTGVIGAVGATGNANVIQYTYATARVTGSEIVYAITGMTQTQLNNAIIFVYVQTSLNPTIWYALPGATSGGSNQYRVLLNPTVLNVYVNKTGTTAETFNTTRVLVIPANDLRTGRKAAVDYSDYEAVKKFYNLPD